MSLQKSLFKLKILSCFCFLLTVTDGGTQPTQLDILAQDDLVLKGTKLHLQFNDTIFAGPRDTHAYIAQPHLQVPKDEDGNFLCYPSFLPRTLEDQIRGQRRYVMRPLESFPVSFDVVHTFGVVSWASRLWQSDLRALDMQISSAPLALYPHDESQCNNAYFTPERGGSLHFHPMRVPAPDAWDRETCTGKHLGWLCHSFDTPTHEYGHAELHRLRPEFIKSWRPETGALHEAYGDLKVIYNALSFPALSAQVLRVTGGDLLNSSFLPDIGEEFGSVIGLGNHGIRSVFNNLTLQDVDCEVHSLSRVFSGAVYDVLASSFEAKQNSIWSCFIKQDDNAVLNKISTDLRQLTLGAFAKVPSEHPTFAEVGKTMRCLADRTPQWTYLSQQIESSFSERGIDIDVISQGVTRCDREVLRKTYTGNDLGANLCTTVKKLWPYEKRVNLANRVISRR